MLREAHKEILADILLNSADTAKVSEILTTLAEDYISVTSNADLLAADNARLISENEGLRAQNMALFLKVGTPIPAADEAPKEDKLETLTYEALFDENGKLI